MIITHNAQYPPNPFDSTRYFSNTPVLSTNVAVPAGCPLTYAMALNRFDTQMLLPANWFPSRLPGFLMFEVSGYIAANDSTKTNLCQMFIRYGSVYSNSPPNGYDGSQAITFSPADYGTWRFFKVVVNGTIPSNGTGKATININSNNDGTGTNWWVAGLSIRKLQ
jgi:hypothetical protein